MKLNLLIAIMLLFSLNLVSAYNGFGYGYFSPSELLENDWIVFALIFIVFFAVSYFALSRTMRDNKGAAAVISIIMALFIAATISQRTRFYGYVGETIGSYLLIIAIILGILLLIKFVNNLLGGIGLFIVLFALWFVLKSFDPYDVFPNEFLTSDFFSIYQFLSGPGFLTFLIIAFLVILTAAHVRDEDINKKIRKWLWGKSKDKKKITIEG